MRARFSAYAKGKVSLRQPADESAAGRACAGQVPACCQSRDGQCAAGVLGKAAGA